MTGEMPIGSEKKTASMIRKPLLALLLCLTASVTLGQYLTEEEEAPEALLATQLGSADVELFLAGSWEASLNGSLGFAVPQNYPAYSTQFPGMGQDEPFRQVPDLLLSLWKDYCIRRRL